MKKSGGDVNIAFAIVMHYRILCDFCQGKMSRIYKIEQDFARLSRIYKIEQDFTGLGFRCAGAVLACHGVLVPQHL